MGLSPGTFLIVNGLIVIFIVMAFVFMRRKPRQPVRLRMREGANSPQAEQDGKSSAPVAQDAKPRSVTQTEYRPRRNYGAVADLVGEVASDPSGDPSVQREKALNVVFNYNGHSWDAYEVLGLPAGSSRENVEKAYRRACAHVQPESLEFVRAAYDAIMKNQ